MKVEYNGAEELFAPKAILALRNLKGIPLYHSDKGLRHPLEIYSITFMDVFERTMILFENLKEVYAELPHIGNKQQGWENRLASNTDNWLDSIIQHIDLCKEILSCFFANDQEKQKNKCIASFSKQYRRV